jgi:hypothetical protein
MSIDSLVTVAMDHLLAVPNLGSISPTFLRKAQMRQQSFLGTSIHSSPLFSFTNKTTPGPELFVITEFDCIRYEP